jgi:hypothetical protein
VVSMFDTSTSCALSAVITVVSGVARGGGEVGGGWLVELCLNFSILSRFALTLCSTASICSLRTSPATSLAAWQTMVR